MKVQISWGLFFCCMLSACSSDNLSDMKHYVEETRNKPAGKIEPLPTMKSFEQAKYSATDLNDPFQLAVVSHSVGIEARPNLHHKAEPLESFPLDSLKMVGTLEMHGDRYAVVTDTSGMIYRVHKGNYIGMNNGQITQISDNRIEVNELISDNNGGWQQRRVVIVMGE